MFIDLLGGGLYGPFELLFGHKVVGLSLPTSGLVLAVGGGVAIAVGPAAGAAVDRFGPSRIVSSANVLGAAGCLLIFSGTAWGFGGGVFLLSASQRAFYGAFTPFVASIAESHDLELWFGRIRAARYIGLGLGQALSGLALLAGQVRGLRLIVALNGVSFLVALAFLVVASTGVAAEVASREEETARGYRAVLSDRANVALAGLNVVATLLIIAPVIATPVFVLERLHLSTWVPGVLVALATAMLAVASFASPRLLRGRRRVRNLAIASSIWALGFLLFVVAPVDRGLALVPLVGAVLLLGFGESLYAPTADTLPAALAPPALRGRYAAFHQIAWGVSETVAPALCGLLLAISSSALWLVLAALGAGSALAYRRLEARIGGRDGIAGAPLPLEEDVAGDAAVPESPQANGGRRVRGRRMLGIVHCPAGGPTNVFGREIGARGHTFDEWSLSWNVPPPRPLEAYDAVLVFGGPMHPDQDDRHPWFRDEIELLRRFLDRGVPLLAVCLGAELLASAADAPVYRAPEPEIGWYRVELTGAGRDDPVLGTLPSSFDALQWHHYTYDLPPTAVELARSARCNQAYRVGECAWGVQFHSEVSVADVERWTRRPPETPFDIEAVLAATERRMAALNEVGRKLCAAFCAVAEREPVRS
jgi:GMP synthase-like glutamine amidotransferase/Na+/melibiose symporter-like transporter